MTYETNQNKKIMENINSKSIFILFQFFIHCVLSSIMEKEVDICQINDISCIAENKIIYLPPIHEGWSEENENTSQMFFIESSGRDHLLPRQACAVESALRNSNIPKIIVGMTSTTLNLTADNSTYSLYQEYSNKGLSFHYIDVEELFKDTTSILKLHELDSFMPQENHHASQLIPTELIKSVHYSDAIRILLIHRYGGWYSDLDMVILKPLTEFKNVLSCDEALEDNDDDEKLLKLDKDGLLEDFLGKKVSNAIFHFEKGHLFLNRSIELFPKLFNGKWGSGGPAVFQRVLNQICQIRNKFPYLSNKAFTPEKCQGVTVLKNNYFYPVSWGQSPKLFINQPYEYWQKLFENSHSVHFYASSNPKNRKVMRPKFYGKTVPAYLYLGLDHCPISFYSVKNF